MICLQDEVSKDIKSKVAKRCGVEVKQVENVVDHYYESIVSKIQENVPVEIKLDFFGKIRAKKSYHEIAEKIKKKFSTLKKVDASELNEDYYEVL